MIIKKNNSGFLLIELLMALTIVSFFLFFITVYMNHILQQKQDSIMQLKALNIAKASIDKLKNNKNPFSLPEKIVHSDYCVTIEPIKINSTYKQFKMILVTTKWKTFSGKEKKLQIISGVSIK